MAWYSFTAHTRALRSDPMSLRPSAASVLEPGERTVRVFSDGVPERDYPEGCQLAVLSTRKVTRQDTETKASGRRLGDYFPITGSVPHHHICGSGRWRGQTSLSVAPSYNRPFFITYLIVVVL